MTLQEKAQIVKDSGIDKKTIIELVGELERIEGIKLTSQEEIMNLLYKFVTILDGDLNKIFNGGLKKII